MKKLKMLASILLVLVLCLSFALPTFVNAAEGDGFVGMDEKKCSITIKGQGSGHEFVAYRIFKGDLNVVEGVKTLSNIEFAHTDASEAQELLDKLNDTFGRVTTPEDNTFKTAAEVADYLSGLSSDEKRPAAVKFATAAYDFMSSINTKYTLEKSGEDDQGKAIYVTPESKIEPGYYLIIDDATEENPNVPLDIYSKFILEVVGDVEVTAKIQGQPQLDKFVGKKVVKEEAHDGVPAVIENDYTPETNMGVDSHRNTANVKDIVPFKIEINFPDLSEYTSYTFKVEDILSEGFTFNNDVKMKIVNRAESAEGSVTDTLVSELSEISDENPDNDFKVTSVSNETDRTTNITIDFKTILDKYKTDKTLVGKIIIIEYSAELNSSAVGNQKPNINKAKLVYTNNPRTNTIGETPEIPTETYTYNVTINKVALENKDAAWGNGGEGSLCSHKKMEGALSDVKFELYRVTADATAEEAEKSEQITNVGDLTTNENGQIELPGLANGKYYLIETQAHAGYNKVLGKIYFTIDAQYDDTSKTVKLNATEGKEYASTPDDAKNAAVLEIIPESYTVNPEVKFDTKGELSLLITNSTGAQLPSTGGIGTVIFTVVGLLVMTSVVAIAVKSNKKTK